MSDRKIILPPDSDASHPRDSDVFITNKSFIQQPAPESEDIEDIKVNSQSGIKIENSDELMRIVNEDSEIAIPESKAERKARFDARVKNKLEGINPLFVLGFKPDYIDNVDDPTIYKRGILNVYHYPRANSDGDLSVAQRAYFEALNNSDEQFHATEAGSKVRAEYDQLAHNQDDVLRDIDEKNTPAKNYYRQHTLFHKRNPQYTEKERQTRRTYNSLRSAVQDAAQLVHDYYEECIGHYQSLSSEERERQFAIISERMKSATQR